MNKDGLTTDPFSLTDFHSIILNNVPHGIVMMDNHHRTLAFNRPMFNLFHLPPDTFSIGMDFRDVLQIWARCTGQNSEMLEQAIRRLGMPKPFSVEFPQTILGKQNWCLLTHTPLSDGNGFVRTFTDITERKHLELELDRLSRIDALTGVMLRRAFEQRLIEEIERAHRFNHPLTLLMVDLDHFKRINDTWGHQAGDVALHRFASICQQVCRRHDLVGRLGGDEFALLLPETESDAATVMAERLREAVARHPIDLDDLGRRERITVSIGVAQLRALDGINELIQRADGALYTAKAAGRNEVRSAVDSKILVRNRR